MGLKFTDFSPEELIGREVLYEGGTTRSSRKRITKIVKCGKKFFSILGNETVKFRLSDSQA